MVEESEENQKKVLDERESLVEMYKAGFLDAYKLNHRLRTKAEWETLNKYYKDAFCDRFEKKVKKVLKGGNENNGRKQARRKERR